MKNAMNMPVLVGAGQVVNRNPEPPCEPMDYMVESARRAALDAGAPWILEKLDSLAVVNVISKSYDDAPKTLAGRLAAHPADLVTTPIGATAPQTLTGRLCDRIARGKSEIGLICGAEAFHSSGEAPDWEDVTRAYHAPPSVALFGDPRAPVSTVERRYGLVSPAMVYPLFANAFRKFRGISPADYFEELGRFCERFSRVARDNPYAWFRDGKSAQEISTVSRTNPLIHYPFTKFMSAMMKVDQGAALLIMDEKRADALGIPADKRVYLLGCEEAYDKWFVSDRAEYYSAPGLEMTYNRAFAQAGVDPGEIGLWDFYNCFPVAAQIAMATLPIREPIEPTVTGGLPYFGGPGNNYSLHAICRMMERLRKTPEKKGLVHSLSWFMNKHTVGIYSGIRPADFQRRNPEAYGHDVDRAIPERPVLEEANGRFEIETYTVSFGREGGPRSAVLVVRNARGERAFAVNNWDVRLMEAMIKNEAIGKTAKVFHDDAAGINRFADIV